MKQLKLFRKNKSYCKLPYCSRCNVRLYNGNALKRSNGEFTSYCNHCNTDIGFMRRYKTMGIMEVINAIADYEYKLRLLNEVLEMKKPTKISLLK
jgi:hypothetical protein